MNAVNRMNEQNNQTNKPDYPAYSFGRQDNRGGLINPARTVGANLKQVEKAFVDCANNRLSQDIGLEFYPLDKKSFNLPFDVLVMGVKVPAAAGEKQKVAFHVIGIIDGTEKYGLLQGVYGQDHFTLEKLPCQMFTEVIKGRVLKDTGKYFNGPVIMAGQSLLNLSTINIDNESDVLAFISSAHSNISTVVNAATLRPFNIAVATKDKREFLETTRVHQTANAKDEYLQPIKADIMVGLQSRHIDQGDGDNTASVELSLATAYVDLLPYQSIAGVSVATNTGPFVNTNMNPNATVDTNIVQSNIVITSITPGVTQDQYNMLMALANVVDATNEGAWWATTLNPFQQPEGSLFKFNGLGYDVGIRYEHGGAPFTQMAWGQSDEFNEEAYLKALNLYVSKFPSYSFDVGLASPGNHRYRFLTDAALENDVQAKEEGSNSLKLLQYCDELCDFKFSELYVANGGSGRPVSVLDNRMILMGDYLERDLNERRDLRDITRQWLLDNIVHEDKANYRLIEEWTAAQINSNLDPMQRIYIQMRILKELLGDNVRFTGYALRYDLEAVFVKTLIEAMVLAGYSTRYNDKTLGGIHNIQNAAYISRSIVNNLNTTAMKPGMVQNNGYNPNTMFAPNIW